MEAFNINKEFDLGKWLFKTIDVPGVYKEMLLLSSNPKAIEEHANGREIQDITEHGLAVCKDPKMKKILCQHLQNSLKTAADVYSRQIIVLAVTYIEAMTKEFFIAAFLSNPPAMYEYLGSEIETGKQGWVQLSMVTEADSISSLLQDLANSAASNASKGKVTSIFKRVTKLTKHKTNQNLCIELQNIIDKRNMIVHEAMEIDVTQEEVEAAYEALADLLQDLGYAAKNGNIPYNDPGQLIDKR